MKKGNIPNAGCFVVVEDRRPGRTGVVRPPDTAGCRGQKDPAEVIFYRFNIHNTATLIGRADIAPMKAIK